MNPRMSLDRCAILSYGKDRPQCTDYLADVADLKSDMQQVKSDVRWLKDDFEGMKVEFSDSVRRREFEDLKHRVTKLEGTN